MSFSRSSDTNAQIDSSSSSSISTEVPFEGDPLCPCLSRQEVSSKLSNQTNNELIGEASDLSSYGLGCAQHDLNSAACQDLDSFCDIDSPLVNCDRGWCQSEWCYVDGSRCHLDSTPSTYFPEMNGLRYSYAACRHPDDFKHDTTWLIGKTLKVGLTSNTGGWKGSYHKHDNKRDFEGSLSDWEGPSIEFLKEAAKLGEFNIDITAPPVMAYNHSREFWGSASSNENLCIYAVSLGLLDLCMAQYTISDDRVSVTDFMVLNNQDLYLILPVNDPPTFRESATLILSSFESQTWLFLLLFVLPTLGILFVVHEHGQPGSIFADYETFIEKNSSTGERVLMHKRIPMIKHVCRSWYLVTLAVPQFEWSAKTISLGGRIHLMGLAFFILTLNSVYTANLTYILTAEYSRTPVASLADAVTANLKLCIDRNNMSLIQKLNNVPSPSFALDQDGNSGFVNGLVRRKVFEMVDADKANAGLPGYCHGAIAPLEDFDVEQGNGEFCGLIKVGDSVGRTLTGFPLFEGKSDRITPLLLKLVSDGLYAKQLVDWRPQSQCPEIEAQSGGEESSLNLLQLIGIWIMTGFFAITGLLAAWYRRRYHTKHKRRRDARHVSKTRVAGFDMKGNIVDKLHRGDEWLRQIAHEEEGRMLLDKGWEHESHLNDTDEKYHMAHHHHVLPDEVPKKKHAVTYHRMEKTRFAAPTMEELITFDPTRDDVERAPEAIVFTEASKGAPPPTSGFSSIQENPNMIQQDLLNTATIFGSPSDSLSQQSSEQEELPFRPVPGDTLSMTTLSLTQLAKQRTRQLRNRRAVLLERRRQKLLEWDKQTFGAAAMGLKDSQSAINEMDEEEEDPAVEIIASSDDGSVQSRQLPLLHAKKRRMMVSPKIV